MHGSGWDVDGSVLRLVQVRQRFVEYTPAPASRSSQSLVNLIAVSAPLAGADRLPSLWEPWGGRAGSGSLLGAQLGQLRSALLEQWKVGDICGLIRVAELAADLAMWEAGGRYSYRDLAIPERLNLLLG